MPEQPTWRQVIEKEAQAAGVPPALAFAIVDQESSGNPAAVGQEVPGQGRAQGFFQLMPATAQGLGVDPTDPYQNIRGGVALLSQLHQRYGNDVPAIVAGYHGGTDLAQHGPKTEQYVKDVLGRLQGAEAPSGASGAPQMPSEPVKGAAAPPAANAAPTSPAAIRFGGGLVNEAITGVTAPFRAIMHPQETLEGLKQNYAQQSEAAKKAYQEGDYTTAAVRGLGSVLPPVAELGDIAAQATGGDWAGAAGRAVGFAAAPKILGAAPRAVGAVGRGVSKTATAVSENPIPTALGAGLGYHYGGLPGAAAGGLTGALTGEVGFGRTGLTHAIARAILKKAEEAPSKVAAGTEVAAESPLVDALTQRQNAPVGVSRNFVLTPEQVRANQQIRRAVKPEGELIGALYQRFGKEGVEKNFPSGPPDIAPQIGLPMSETPSAAAPTRFQGSFAERMAGAQQPNMSIGRAETKLEKGAAPSSGRMLTDADIAASRSIEEAVARSTAAQKGIRIPYDIRHTPEEWAAIDREMRMGGVK